MIHTGSRGLGHQVCTDFLKLTEGALRRYGITVPDRQLACAPVDSEEARAYLGAMRAAANFAFANREVLTHWTREAFARALDGSAGQAGIRVVYDPRLVVHAPVDEACLTPRYFRRWSFTAGITRSGGVEATRERLPRVQPWIYRQAMEDAVIVALGRLRPMTP